MKKLLILFFVVFSIYACSNDPFNITVEELEADLVRIRIENNTEKNYRNLTLIITYLDDSKEKIKVDTVSYKMHPTSSCEDCIFLEAKESTFIVQKVPVGTRTVEAKMYQTD
ncbi:hypothetical protein Belba_3186 [Belliella baltica DSM 15883]|uniref:Lipoprotein n=1 Tax=Belliella baltica (strain DSM 15883 / CIP 108006 / LMG 21964 / BA134) TaxID=866536 RepID=I3Z8Y0_BELBD|nr:hypothetical protein [Belliella baltica]AFL85698.1 hypothetical protein Belba_3186 [Belliella baltica DSM 15883]